MSTKAEREIAHKLKVFEHAKQSENVAFTCSTLGYRAIPIIAGYRTIRKREKKDELIVSHAQRILNSEHLSILWIK